MTQTRPPGDGDHEVIGIKIPSLVMQNLLMDMKNLDGSVGLVPEAC